ncbi:hypothetical protein [Cupriavidus metallidurans]
MNRLMPLLLLALAGCAASVEPMTTPDGKQGFVVSCDGSADSWGSCYKAATKACGGRYEVIDKNQTGTSTAYGPLVNRNLVISCKG